ncbi:LysR family transcriptional regulator (chromosome initiation inhibitor) [Desulfobaculum xiamenense]|uniref:LysR family transcriptional regulator (Chromosome initiation inhibitor) n=1 Tax=Desulfobaculum xiamenense TaxID=995050 RepID=A0A846QJZ6_9BACT|nr:LysR family transcriptional regulator ArgP [Desulfobaculum xiamenense]NJB66802.1 LysR family transcriptional regulator (chromosome initiation inhibitor) [Desulfobaculum xiamenense]
MLDYKLLEALTVVVREQGFENAARVLHITQSAVSQRVKLLEERMGQALVVRGTPVTPTDAGRKLLRHFEQVKLLEEQTLAELSPELEEGPVTLSVGVHADSLATWFLEAVAPMAFRHGVLLDLVLEDQENTHQLLRRGEVVACVGTHPTPVQGGRTEYLGRMRYVLVAAPDFAQRWFGGGVTAAKLTRAPAVIFNRKDELHFRFLEKHYGLTLGDTPFHIMPSSEAFVEATMRGMAYTLVPELQVLDELDEGMLVNIAPDRTIELKLHWHTWGLKVDMVDRLTELVVRHARKVLPQ